MIIRVIDVVGSDVVSYDSGKILRRYIKDTIELDDDLVIISFEGVPSLTAAFLNSGIGQLYKSYSTKFIRKNIVFSDLTPPDARLLHVVMEFARSYHNNKKFRKAVKKAIMEDEEEE